MKIDAVAYLCLEPMNVYERLIIYFLFNKTRNWINKLFENRIPKEK